MKRSYNLFTAVTLICGIVIGSGIFFKADDVLLLANNNIFIDVILFAVGAVAVIFGSLSLSQLATRTDKPGGLVSYAEDFVGLGTACVFGWFQTFLYLPAICAVVSWISGQYVCMLFGWEPADPTVAWAVIGIVLFLLLAAANAVSARLGGAMQNISMIVKLLPLILLAVAGFVFGKPAAEFSAAAGGFSSAMGIGILSAFGPIAFSFDGWMISTTVCHEIKNSRKNLPIALTVAPLIILAVYILYFLGVTLFMGAENVVALGNAAPLVMVSRLAGPVAEKIVLVTIIVSVLGTVNGLTLGMIRMPYSLAKRGMMPFLNKQLAKTEKKVGGMPVNAAVFMSVLTLLWLLVHIVTVKLLLGVDISEIAVGVSYLLYIILYAAVMRLRRKREIRSGFMGTFVPIMAMAGSVIIISGSVASKMFPLYFTLSAALVAAALIYYRRNKNRITPMMDERDCD